MKRTHKMLTVMALALPALYFGSANEAVAFCIHNWTDTVIGATQVHGGTSTPFKGFTQNMDPGEKACCNWDTHDCNTQGGRDAPVKFNIWVVADATSITCRNFTIKANGKVVVRGHYDTARDDSDITCTRE